MCRFFLCVFLSVSVSICITFYFYVALFVSKRDSLTVRAFACHAAGPGSNLVEDDLKNCTSFFFRLRGRRLRNDCGKIEWIVDCGNVECRL